MPGHDIIVIGASAGGVEALLELAKGLPADLPAAVFVVHHFPAHSTSVLPNLLNRRGPLYAAHPQNGEPIRHGRIYVAPPDLHLLIHRGHVRLARGPRENSNRPAIDPLFRTAARSYGRRVVGVVLSGTLDDGTLGLQAIKLRGGVAVVQDPADALYGSMPRSAIENVAVDHVLPVARIPAVLVDLAHQPVTEEGEAPMSEEMEVEADMAELEPAAVQQDDRPGTPSAFSCPECGGPLWELQEGQLVHYRCRVGHAFSNESLIAEQSNTLEAALWTALRALKESGALARRLARGARERGHLLSATHFEAQAREADKHAAIIQQVLMSSRADSAEIPDERPGRKARGAGEYSSPSPSMGNGGGEEQT